MLALCIFQLHAGLGGGIHQSWWFLFLNFCTMLYSLPIWFVFLFLLLFHLDSVNLWPSFLLSFFFPSLKNLIPFSSLRHLIQSLPSGSQLQPQLLLKQILFTHFKFLVSLPFAYTTLLWPTFSAVRWGCPGFSEACLSLCSDGKINSWWNMGSICVASNVRGTKTAFMAKL